MKKYEISVLEVTYNENTQRETSIEIYSQTITEEYTNQNPTWLSRVIAVINCLPFPLFNITEPKEK